mgnify:CR=1 FL=1
MEIIACFFVLVYPYLLGRTSCNHAIANRTVSAVHGLQKCGIIDKIIVSANFFPFLTRIGLSEGFLTTFLENDISEVPL